MFRIKEILDQQGITAKELANRMNVTPQYISGIIRETGSASVGVLSKIANELNVPIAALFDDYRNELNGDRCPHCGQPIKIRIEKAE